MKRILVLFISLLLVFSNVSMSVYARKSDNTKVKTEKIKTQKADKKAQKQKAKEEKQLAKKQKLETKKQKKADKRLARLEEKQSKKQAKIDKKQAESQEKAYIKQAKLEEKQKKAEERERIRNSKNPNMDPNFVPPVTYFKSNVKSHFLNPNLDVYEVRASHILVKKRKDAVLIRKDILSGEITFEEAAKKYSLCPTGPYGGDLGYFNRKKMAQLFADTAFDLKVGEISQPVGTKFGWHIIKTTDKR